MPGCASGKVRFKKRESADRALLNAKIGRALRNSQKRREVRVYQCPSCKGWHLTSKP